MAFSFSIKSSGFIHTVTGVSISFFLKTEQHSIICSHHIVFIHLLFNRHLVCFHLLSIVNVAAAMNTGVQVSLRDPLLGLYPEV